MTIAREVFILQRRLKGGDYVDWTNPMTERTEYATLDHARNTLLRRANAVDYRIVRRVWAYTDFPVGASL